MHPHLIVDSYAAVQAQRKQQGQAAELQQSSPVPVDASSRSKQEGPDNKALEEEEEERTAAGPVTPPPPPYPHHRRNVEWLGAFDVSSIAA